MRSAGSSRKGVWSCRLDFRSAAIAGGVRPIIGIQAEWDAYGWNPPEYLSFSAPDPEASPKPTWEELIEAAGHAERDDLVAR